MIRTIPQHVCEYLAPIAEKWACLMSSPLWPSYLTPTFDLPQQSITQNYLFCNNKDVSLEPRAHFVMTVVIIVDLPAHVTTIGAVFIQLAAFRNQGQFHFILANNYCPKVP